MSWSEAFLKDLADIQLGKMLDKKKNQGEYRPYLGNDNVQWGFIDTSQIKEMKFKSSELERFSLRHGDILVCEGGDPGRCALWLSDTPMCYQKALHRVRVYDRLDSRYLFHYLTYLGFTQEIRQYYTGGATIKHLPKAALSRVVIRYPEISIQKRIASILSAYDELIENNRKQIKLLEEAAQRLYKEWFIDFKFPGHETTPIDPETNLPKGWKRGKVEDVLKDIESGKRPKGGIDKSLQNGIPSVGAENVIGLGEYNYSAEKLIPTEFAASMKKGIVQNKDILIYKDGAYTGRASLFQDGFPHATCVVNEHVFLIRAKDDKFQYWLFFTIQNEYETMQALSASSAQPGINQADVRNIRIMIPSIFIVEVFDSCVSPIVSKIFTLANQNKILQEARDRLLPKLMSGEIEVN